MKSHIVWLVCLAVVPTAWLVVSCQKPLHQENEKYYFVSANITLPYWQEAQAGFMDAARVLGVKAEFTGPEVYSPDQELEAFKTAESKNPAGIPVSPAPAELFTGPLDSAGKAGIPVLTADSGAPASHPNRFLGTDH